MFEQVLLVTIIYCVFTMLSIKKCKLIVILFLYFISQLTVAQTEIETDSKMVIQWFEWSDAAFEQADKEGKLVLLDIGAQWCQFCKKMEQVTYQDPAVIKIIQENYIAIQADIETTQEVHRLYESFGVPGTIVLTPKREEINKRRGYINPLQMQWHLLGILQDA